MERARGSRGVTRGIEGQRAAEQQGWAAGQTCTVERRIGRECVDVAHRRHHLTNGAVLLRVGWSREGVRVWPRGV